jgi:protein ImuA
MSIESPSGSPQLRVVPSAAAAAARAPNPAAALRPEPGRLHEFHAATADAPAAAAAALLSLGAAPDRPLAWLRTEAAERSTGRLHGPGLAALGLAPHRLLLGLFADPLDLMKAAAELLKSGTAAAVLLELHGPCPRLDLTASRRLALAAAAGSSVALMLRIGLVGPASACLSRPIPPSAAWRRWKVAARPSRPLATDAPGAPAFALELLRNRQGPAGAAFTLDWQAGCLAPRPHWPPDLAETRHAPLAGDHLPLPVDRPLAAGNA